MPLPTTQSTEEIWLTALVAYLATETGITWEYAPRPANTADTPTAGVWVEADSVPDRPNILNDLTRDQVISIWWQVRAARVAGSALQARWKAYILDVFQSIRRNGIGTVPGAFLGIQPYAGNRTDGLFLFPKSESAISNTSNASAIVDFTLEFRYVYKLPARSDC